MADSRLLIQLENIVTPISTPMDCPFGTFGCINEGFREDNVKVHLHLDELKHSQMIVQAVNLLKNDLNGLKQILGAKEIEIKEIKEDSRRKEILMREEMNALKNEIKILKDNQERKEIQSEVMKEEEMVIMRRDLNELKMLNVEMNKNKEVKLKKMATNAMLLDKKEDFVWTIKNFTKKINKNGVYLSDSFYKDDYKLCLRAKIVYRCLYFSVIIMKGERDDTAEWPMKHTIIINMINQDSQHIHKCWTVDYSKYKNKSLFDKPKSNMNKKMCCGDIFYKDFEDIEGMIKDDSLTIECSLSSN